MTRQDLREQLSRLDLTHRPEERPHRGKMVTLLDSGEPCFHRTCHPAHFTGSALVISADGSRVLLHHHRKLDCWLQFGGHCDGEENVLQVAEREALEESGVPGLEVISEMPFDLDIHPIPPKGGEPAHWHYDVRYLLRAPEGAQFVTSEESHEVRWFAPEELGSIALSAGLNRLIEKWVATRG